LAEIRPFRGTYYHKPAVKDLAAVICPPYDIISPQQREELYQRSEFNFVRVEYERELPQDNDTHNKYTRAAATLHKWLKQGVLKAGETPAIYLHDHHFTYQGKKYRRRGLTCLVKLEEWSRMVVRPHEGTLARAKSDRLSLLYALQADTSPILALFEGGPVAPVLAAQARRQPMLDIKVGAESHQLWAVTDASALEKLSACLAKQPIYIADGHHRYESALTYQRERRASAPVAGEAPFDFVMMTLVDITDPGLVIMPAHRMVRGMPLSTVDGLPERLAGFFEVEKRPLDAAHLEKQLDGLLVPDTGDVRLVLYGPEKESIFLLRLRDPDAVRPMMPYFHDELYRRLDVSVVDHVIVEELLGLSHETAGAFLAYNHDGTDAVKLVRDQEYQLALIVRPVRPGIVKAVADSRDRMPRKSTYFYPKAPAGLVFYHFG
jgi:uncharacterized protein (DUF1015 family)